MFFRKACLALTVVPMLFSCTVPGTGNNTGVSGSIATKADAIKYFECALNNPNISAEQKATIKSTVMAQINLIPDIAWAQAKAGFEDFAKTYSCESLANPSAQPSASPASAAPSSPQPTASVSSGSSASAGLTLSSKEDYIKLLNCANNYFVNEADKTNLSNVMLGVELTSELNASRFLDDATFTRQKARLEGVANKFSKYCSSSSNETPATSTEPLNIAGITEHACDAEKTLKSATGPSINISFVNKTNGNVKLYWLDQGGSRRAYNNSLAVGAKHDQQTFVTHPWVVTDAEGKCIKLFVPSDASADKANIEIK